VAASAWKAVEFAGLPGIGKTTIARALVELIDLPNVRTRTGMRHRIDTLVSLVADLDADLPWCFQRRAPPCQARMESGKSVGADRLTDTSLPDP